MRIEDLRDHLVLRRHLARPWKFLRDRRRAFAERLIDIPLRDGGAFRLRPSSMDRHVFHRVFARDEYRIDGIAPGSLGVVVDVGAHIGAFSVRAARLAARVIACEPSPENIALFALNTARFPNIRGLSLAVAGRHGPTDLFVGHDPAAHSVFPAGGPKTVTVRCVTLEDLFSETGIERCDLLKLDCEGAEHGIIRMAPPGLLARIDRVCMEYHDVPGSTGEDVARALAAAGHAVEMIPRRKAPRTGYIYSRLKATGGR
jgi:FkbM family methyltransferase